MIPYLFDADARSVMTGGSVSGNGIALPYAIYCEVTEELNGEYTLAMGYPATELDKLVSGGSSGILDMIIAANISGGNYGWEPFRIYQCDKVGGIYEIQAHHITYDMAYYVTMSNNTYTSINQLIQYWSSVPAWEAYGFTITNTYNHTWTDAIMLEPQSMRQAIYRYCLDKQYGAAEMRVAGWTIMFEEHRGETIKTPLRDGINCEITSVKTNNEDQFNAVAPWMNVPDSVGGGERPRWVLPSYAPGAITRINKFYAKNFDNELDIAGMGRNDTALRNIATRWVAANYKNASVSIEAKIYQGYTVSYVGDTFTIIAPRMNMDSYTGRLMKLTYDILNERPLNAYFDTIRMGVGDIIWTR